MAFDLQRLLPLLVVSGCSAALQGDGPSGSGPDVLEEAPPESPVDDGPPEETPPSAEAPVFAKNGAQLQADLAQALVLPADGLCVELGETPCAEVHQIVLGGVEPYTLRIDVPLAEPSATTPLAIERMAWGACTQAVDRDLGPGPAEVLVPGSDGLNREASAQRLAERLLHRPPEPAQVMALSDFGAELADRDWALSACVAVASSFEVVFY